MSRVRISGFIAVLLLLRVMVASSAFAQSTISIAGDCSGSGSSTIAVACTKTGGVVFAPSATTDTTNASNISSGSLADSRLAPGVAPLNCVNPTYYGFSNSASGSVNQTAMNTAIGTGRDVCLSEGTFHTAGSFAVLSAPGQRVFGAGRDMTIIVNDAANQPTFVLSAYAQGIEVSDLTVTRSVAAVSGGDGIDTGAASNRIAIRRTHSTKNYFGYALVATAWGDSQDNIAESNISDGFAILTGNFSTYGTAAGGLQWNFTGQNLSQANGGWGFHYDSTATCPSSGSLWQVTLNPSVNLYTFGNGSGGVSFTGTATCPIEDIQMQGGFLGTDKGNEIFVSSYGTYAAINGTFIENAGGGSSTGIAATAINIQSNLTGPIRISGVDITSSNGQGIVSSATNTIVTNSKVNNSGQAVTTFPNLVSSGITLGGANSMIIGGQTTGAQYGAQINGAGSAIIGLDAHGNSVSGLNGVAGSLILPANTASGNAVLPYGLTITGTVNATNFNSGASAGVSCSSLGSSTIVTNGIITHC